jgi:predicted permease
VWRDLRLAFRTIGRQPALTGVIAATLALGIGGTTAIFSVVNAVLLRDLPYPDATRIYLMRSLTADGSPTGAVTPRDLVGLMANKDHPVVDAAALAWSQQVQIVGADGRPHSTTRYGVTDQFFDVFGTQMALGRAFERGQAPGPIVIAYATWRDLFASDPNIVGKTVSAEGIDRQVVGVARADFEFPENPGFWYLMRLGAPYDNVRAYRGFVRLRTGQTRDRFQDELTRLASELRNDPVTSQPLAFVAQPFLEYVVGDLRRTVMILMGGAALLLVIACINVTTLLLSRTAIRSREMAVREALGAGRWTIVRQLVAESGLTALLGGVLGLAVGAIGLRLLMAIGPADLPRLGEVPLDANVLSFALGTTLLTGVLVGLAPSWRLARHQLRTLINEGGRGTSASRAQSRLFAALVVAEMALAVLLVIAAGLLVRSYVNLTATPPGFHPDRIATFYLYVPGRVEITRVPNAQGRDQVRASYLPMGVFFRELEQRIQNLSGVQAAATTTSLPLNAVQYDASLPFHLPGQSVAQTDETAHQARGRSVSPTFFHTMGIRVLAGRSLLDSDRHDAPGVAVVNETFVRRHFAGQNPLGQRIRFAENLSVPGNVGFQLSHRLVDDLEVVGVVEDVRYLALGEPAEPAIYLSSDQWIHRRRALVVRSATENPAGLINVVKREIEAMDPLLTAEVNLYPAIVRASVARERLGMMLLVTFGLMAVGLAAIGIYGLMAHTVTQRSGEVAVRVALGATAAEIRGLFIRRGALLAAAGIALGVIGALALRQVVANQLYGVSAIDPQLFVIVPAVLLFVATLACLLPAWRAARVDPADLLRSE